MLKPDVRRELGAVGPDVLPDVVVVWPSSCDYPLWRRWLKAERHRFARVAVAFHRTHHRDDYRAFLAADLARHDVLFVDPATIAGHDWRSCAVNAALELCRADLVLFTEQDFLITNPAVFWDAVEIAAAAADVVSFEEDGTDRLHPCFLLARRPLVEATRRDFSVSEDGDHFARFGRDLRTAGATIDTNTLARIAAGGGWRHLAGLSHNHHLIADGQPVTYKPDELASYLRACLASAETIAPAWRAQAERHIGRAG